MSPTTYTHLLLPCPTCQGQQYRTTPEDAEPPAELPDTSFCHYCDRYDGLREVWLPTRLVLHAYREGRTDQQAYAELADYLLANSTLPERAGS